MSRSKILKEHDIRVWQFQPETEKLIFWSISLNQLQSDGDEKRIHPDDWPLFLEKVSFSKKVIPFNVPLRVLLDGKWNWYSFRLKKSVKNSLFEGLMIPINDEMDRLNQTIDLCQAKEKVYRALGHDLKGQFSSLLGFSDILSNSYEELDELSRLKYIGFMKTIASNTHLLVDNMLNWAKLKQGQIAIQKQPILLSDKLEEVLGYIQFSLQTKQIKLKKRFKPGTHVWADSVLLSSVLLNLITNAAKFSDQGQVVEVSAIQKTEGITLKIKDFGTGIAPDVLHQIFDPETLITKKGTNNEAGTGLGLKISREFILLMGGKLTIHSKPEKGTRITLFLPSN